MQEKQNSQSNFEKEEELQYNMLPDFKLTVKFHDQDNVDLLENTDKQMNGTQQEAQKQNCTFMDD